MEATSFEEPIIAPDRLSDASLSDDPETKSHKIDRPAWIPPEITHDWDTNPYAYQTEEELMAAGGPHGQLLAYVMELLRHFLAGKDLMLLLDTFMLYRDAQGIKRRIAPDLLLMPYRRDVPLAYDLDVEIRPSFVAEVTSKKSHLKDLQENVTLYFGLGIQTYLVIDAANTDGTARPQINLHLWRSIQGTVQKLAPDVEGYFTLPEMGLKIRAIGQQIIFVDVFSDEVLLDMSDFSTALAEEQAEKYVEREAHAATKAALQAAEAHVDKAHQTMALAMWQKGLELTLIAEVTGISETELEKLVR